MKKIPTLFRRDPDNMSRVLNVVTEGCEWVMSGEGIPTAKFDGTCVLVDRDESLWMRREVKAKKQPPARYRPIETDANTGKTVGWEPYDQSSFSNLVDEAIEKFGHPDPGTYELCGPKVNGNPHQFARHALIRHGAAKVIVEDYSYSGIHATLENIIDEGIVWHHHDGRRAKIKRRDFGLAWPNRKLNDVGLTQ